MKRIIKIFFLLLLPSSCFLSSCEDMLEVDSKSVLFVDDNKMNADSLYSMFGILSQLQNLADSYVILGELRGDLLKPATGVNKYLDEIYYFGDYSDDNPYTTNQADYYAVINNCNYVIENVDTTNQNGGVEDMYKVLAAAKGIKAWTYMQLVLNFGEVYYFDKPVLSIGEANKEKKAIGKEELFPILIEELLPFKKIEPIYPGSFGGFCRTELLTFSIPFLLGDLYLWTDNYLAAANEYRDLMYGNNYIVSANFRSTREAVGTGSTMEFSGVLSTRWSNIFDGKSSAEMITLLAVSNEFEYNTSIDSMFLSANTATYELTQTLLPTNLAIEKFDSAFYFHAYYTNGSLTTHGDLRKYGTFYSYNSTITDELTENHFVYKYYSMNYNNGATQANVIVPYRIGLLYLHYAEAINRLGKPNLAMAVLKNGLKKTTLANRTIIPANEIEDPLPNYMDFKDSRFDNNIGIRARGLGHLESDTTFYIINPQPTSMDSVLFVENLIQEELALETAYEGNRFQDLVRLAIRRNDNSYLANIVASKFEDQGTKVAIRQKLMDRSNWYVK
ncbi:MAG: RagB/SusD family nutrient uptake outer membrane protein [Marinilabiliaceae bacterium]|nr:RagB/SusD family nutrient uptake outer membrane protein [Marinilabiliaceae bacterium]MBN2819103.1 RagB/SusD family nutrient uptake outer membrane protein [Bacteroidales bacterium]